MKWKHTHAYAKTQTANLKSRNYFHFYSISAIYYPKVLTRLSFDETINIDFCDFNLSTKKHPKIYLAQVVNFVLDL